MTNKIVNSLLTVAACGLMLGFAAAQTTTTPEPEQVSSIPVIRA
jgi:hypothetical protein